MTIGGKPLRRSTRRMLWRLVMWRRRPRLLLERKLLLRVLPTSGGARGELLGYAGGQCHLHGGGVVVDEVAGGLHGHPAVKIRPSFGQLVDV